MTVCTVAAALAMFCYKGADGRENDGGMIGGERLYGDKHRGQDGA